MSLTCPECGLLPDNPACAMVCRDRSLADLEAATVLDAERMHYFRWQWKAAAQRIHNRKPEIERLRKEMWG